MYKFIIGICIICTTGSVAAQEVLKLDEAVRIMLENDYDIKVASKNLEVAENNTSIYANNYLPQVTGKSGANVRSQNLDTRYHDETSRDVRGANSLGYSASLGFNYTLFDGMYRSYNFEKSKELHHLSKLQVRHIIEGALINLFSSYYTVANLTESFQSLQQSVDISKERLLRAQYGAEYGRNTQLDVLNAQVDVNSDSINLINNRQNLANAKRNLNVLLGRELTTQFAIDTAVSYDELNSLDALLSQAQEENVRLLTSRKNLELSDFNIKLLKTNRIPTLALSGSYAWNNTNYNDQNLIDVQTILGPQAELSLSWSIFDGGRTKIGLKNAKLAAESSLIQQEQAEKQVERDVINAYATYQNSIQVLSAEKANLQTNQRNFDRTEELYKLGQLTSIEFRQAQLNLLYSETRYKQSKYQAKLYELSLFRLTGNLLNMKF